MSSLSSSVATNQQFAKILEQQGILPVDVLDGLVTRAKLLQEWLGQVAVDDKILTYEEVADALARELNLPLVKLKTLNPDPRALERLPMETCKSHGVVPIRFEGLTLFLAMANPLDQGAKTTLRTLARCELSVQVAPMDAIAQTIESWYTQPVMEAPAPQRPTDLSSLFAKISLPSTIADEPDFRQDPNVTSLDELLQMMMEHRASDLHLAVGSPPVMRVDGELRLMPFPVLTPSSIQTMIYVILTDIQVTTFERNWELDFAYSLPGLSRFRVNVHRQRGSVGGVFRTIPTDIPTLDKLRMPPIVRELTMRPRGLVLVTGPTGSGKSTTLAAMIDEINRTRRTHIVTVEDPIEFLHNNKLSVVTQREIGADTESFTTALRHVLRQDPDVILIGEMRDLETISAAVTAAETGHLVFATLHTTSAAQTIDRIIDVFPPHQQQQIRSMLANVLEGIITQTLLLNIDGRGRSCAQEILVCTSAVRTLIREAKVHQMSSVMQASAKYGMQTLDQALKQLVLGRKVTLEEAIKKSSNPEDFKTLVALH